MKKIRFMDVSFRDGFQSVLGARVKKEDFLPALSAAAEAGIDRFEVAGGARFQSPFFYCQENAFDMMDECRAAVGPDVNLQSLARGANVVGLVSQCREIIDLHAKLFHKHGITTIRNFDALNDVRNLDYSGRCIKRHGAKHQVCVTLMGLPPGVEDDYAHTAQFYADRVKQIVEAGIPFDSLCFKDASGTAPPAIVHDAVKLARDILDGAFDDHVDIHFHTHTTGGSAGNCLMGAIEAGADIIDLAMAPVSGGTSHMDILSMWHILKGTNYTLDIDYTKILKVEEYFKECMEKYFMGQESKETNPLIVLSPMPGGALTANTQMMRDNNCMHLYNDVINAMCDVVRRGGFGSSVTPVSQFYFQQAFFNVTQGEWKNLWRDYALMVLGYFGKTPAEPDPEIVKLASEQLGMEPTTEDVHDINDRNPELGIAPATKALEDAGLPVNEENIFIAAACADKGIAFLKGEAPLMIRLAEDEERKVAEKYAAEFAPAAPAAAAPASDEPGAYTVTVNGKQYHVEVAPAAAGEVAVQSVQAAPAAAPAPAPASNGQVVEAPMPGTVLRIHAEPGTTVEAGDVLIVLESMKMEVEIKASADGTVSEIHVGVGETVKTGQPVATI